ncbi:hypothetical protein QP017_05085 [Gallibacterium anatis]|uniref:Uncharacterized protein n=1 Tax=Gallibacterium anatis TaxID=750 RepID=A0AAX3XFJ0_9PAST|nr:hypothetical protein [Gallibacterium anatis]MDK9560756.1 hypothetical protein [Gallibacterium anatis]WIM80170.1 hypothetical protein QP018_02755 [Gallibacterium anatis]
MEASMSSIRFDKLKFVKILEKEGNQSPESAEAFAKAIEEALTESQSSLATKSDMHINFSHTYFYVEGYSIDSVEKYFEIIDKVKANY